MALTIDSITGSGGTPPTDITIKGTVTGCEKVYVTIDCTNQVVTPIDIPNGGFNYWSVTYKNDKGCTCGSQVTAHASCLSGMPASATLNVTLPLVCDNPPPPANCCDEVTVSIDTNPLPCIPFAGNPVSIQFSAAILPSGCVGPFEWKVSNLSITPVSVLQPFTSGSAVFSFPFAQPGTYKVNVRVQQSGTCPDPVLTDSITFTLVQCGQCYTLSVTATPSGCAHNNPGINLKAVVMDSSGVIVVPPAGTVFHWTLDDPGTVSSKQAKQTGSAQSIDTSSGWTGTLATAGGAVDLSQYGTYTILVHADIPGTDPACDPAGSAFALVPVCKCPAPVSGQQQEWTVTNVSAPSGSNIFQTLDCNKATTALTLSVDPGDYLPGDLLYNWDFGDGSPVVSVLGTAGSSQNHTFTNPVPGQSHTYLVSVTISVPGSTCNPFARTASITVPGCVCPPGQEPDANGNCVPICPEGHHRDENGNCVPDSPPPPPPPACSIWCILAGIFLIAVPISAQISTAAHCIGGPLQAIVQAAQAALIVIAISAFIFFCGICCLWPFLLAGAALGVVATAVASYWLGAPGCWIAGLILVVGYIISAFILKAVCEKSKK